MINCIHISKYDTYLDITQINPFDLHDKYVSNKSDTMYTNKKIILNITDKLFDNAINISFIDHKDFTGWFKMIYKYVKILNNNNNITIIYNNKEQLYTILYSYIKCNKNIEVDIRTVNKLRQLVKNDYGKYIKKFNEIINNKVIFSY